MPRTRITAASAPPGGTTVAVRTVVSYCRVTHFLLAIVGEESRRSSVHTGSFSSARSGISCTFRARSALIASLSRASGVYTGQSVTRREPGNSATTRSPSVTRYTGSAITSPITSAARSHFARMSRTCCSRPRFATTSMRSCDSLSRISYGVMPVSRTGTFVTSIVTPTSPRAAISAELDVSPAAPMSWIATMCPLLINSRLASSSSFSVNGSPTCTRGRFASLDAERSSEANDAPWMPSRPVRAPTAITGFPTPSAFARMRSLSCSSPTHIALTSGFPSYAGSNMISPATVGIPTQFP